MESVSIAMKPDEQGLNHAGTFKTLNPRVQVGVKASLGHHSATGHHLLD